jgi:hypothetical protein
MDRRFRSPHCSSGLAGIPVTEQQSQEPFVTLRDRRSSVALQPDLDREHTRHPITVHFDADQQSLEYDGRGK